MWLHDNFKVQGYPAPAPPANFDQFLAQQPMVGAVLLVGGLVLWFMPREIRF